MTILASSHDGGMDAIRRKLNELNSNSIPVLAIYPGGRPSEVIVLRDLLVESQVVKELERAGPSARLAPEKHQMTSTAPAEPEKHQVTSTKIQTNLND